MTRHRVIGDGCISEGISLMNAWMPVVSVRVIHHGVFKRENLMAK